MRKSVVAVAFAVLLVSAGSAQGVAKKEEQRAIQDDMALITQVAILNSIQTAQEVLKLTAGISTSVISTSQDLIKNAQGTLAEVAGILAQAGGGGASSRFTPQIASEIINNFFKLASSESALAQALFPIIVEAQIKNTNVLFDLINKSVGNIDSTVQEVVTNVQGNLQLILSAASPSSRQGGLMAMANQIIAANQQIIATTIQQQQAAIGNAVAMIQTFWAALGGTGSVEALNDVTIITGAQSAKAVLGLVKATSSDVDDAAQAIIGNIQEAIQKVAGVLAAAAAPASRGLLGDTQQAATAIFAQIMTGNTALVQALAPPLVGNAIYTTSSLLTLGGNIISQVDDATGAIVDNTNANLDAIIAGVQA